MKKIYVLLMHTNTKPSKFVKIMTRYEYSHVALSLEKECNTIYSFGRRKLHSILGGGFSVENKDGEFFKLFNKTRCKIYELEVENEQYLKIKDALMRCGNIVTEINEKNAIKKILYVNLSSII